MQELLEMSDKELDRCHILQNVLDKRITQIKAAELLGLSTRQVRNLTKVLLTKGKKGLISKKRGKPSNRSFSPSFRDEVLSYAKDFYLGYSPKFIKDKLEEVQGIILPSQTLRNWLIEEGLWEVKRWKAKKLHRPRARREHFGELIQADGSHHRWFGQDLPVCNLCVFIDDATSKITAMRFSEGETLDSYFETFSDHLRKYGKPRALYTDRAKVFKGDKNETHFQRALRLLGVESILAYSPQAKGRVERANRTLQDRLIKELELRGIKTIKEGNEYLDEFIERHNSLFSKEPMNKLDVHRPLEEGSNLKRVLSRYEERTLRKDLSFQIDNKFYKILEGKEIKRPLGRKVEVRRIEGKICVYLNDKELKCKPLNEIYDDGPKYPDLRLIIPKTKKKWSPGKNHPWKGGAA